MLLTSTQHGKDPIASRPHNVNMLMSTIGMYAAPVCLQSHHEQQQMCIAFLVNPHHHSTALRGTDFKDGKHSSSGWGGPLMQSSHPVGCSSLTADRHVGVAEYLECITTAQNTPHVATALHLPIGVQVPVVCHWPLLSHVAVTLPGW